MALHVGLRRAKPLAGIVGFSGMLAGPTSLKDEIKSKPPVLLVHGDSDEMLPAVLTQRAAQTLQRERRAGRRAHRRRASATASTRPGLSHCRALRARGVQAAGAEAMTEGTCRPGFERVAEAFEKNFKDKGESRRLGLPDGGRRDGGRPVGRRCRPEDQGAVDARHGRASSSPAPRARRRSARMCWRAAASSISTRRSPSCGRSSRKHGKERVTTRMMLDHSLGVPAAARQGEGRAVLTTGTT